MSPALCRSRAPVQAIASISRVFMNEQRSWTLQATCSVCLHETLAPLLMGVPIECAGCGVVLKIDPARTVFHRSDGSGFVPEPTRRFRWGSGVARTAPRAPPRLS